MYNDATMRRETIETPYGDVSVIVLACAYCGLEKLNTWPGWEQIDIQGFTLQPYIFCSMEHAGLYLLECAKAKQAALVEGDPLGIAKK